MTKVMAHEAHDMVQRMIHSAEPGVNTKGEHFVTFELRAPDYALLMLTIGVGVGAMLERERHGTSTTVTT